MGINILFFDSVVGLAKYVDEELNNANELYSSYAKRIEDTRAAAFKDSGSHNQKKSSSSGRKSVTITQDQIAGFKVLVNPTPDYELSILDECMKTLHEKIDALRRIKDKLLPVAQQNVRIAAILEDSIPIAFMYYADD